MHGSLCRRILVKRCRPLRAKPAPPRSARAAHMRALVRLALPAAALLGAVMLPGCTAECSADPATWMAGESYPPTPTPTEMAGKCCDA